MAWNGMVRQGRVGYDMVWYVLAHVQPLYTYICVKRFTMSLCMHMQLSRLFWAHLQVQIFDP